MYWERSGQTDRRTEGQISLGFSYVYKQLTALNSKITQIIHQHFSYRIFEEKEIEGIFLHLRCTYSKPIFSNEMDVCRGNKSTEMNFDSFRSWSCYEDSAQRKSCMSIRRIKETPELVTKQRQIRCAETDWHARKDQTLWLRRRWLFVVCGQGPRHSSALRKQPEMEVKQWQGTIEQI